MSTDTRTLRALIAEWRAKSESHRDGFQDSGDFYVLLVCADELEAALEAQPSSGWQDIDSLKGMQIVGLCRMAYGCLEPRVLRRVKEAGAWLSVPGGWVSHPIAGIPLPPPSLPDPPASPESKESQTSASPCGETPATAKEPQ